MKKRITKLETTLAPNKTYRVLNSDDTTLPLNERLDKLSLWTLASDVKVDNDNNLKDYFEAMILSSDSGKTDLSDLITYLRSMDKGVTNYSTPDTIATETGNLNTPIINALETITGRQMNDTTSQGIVDFMTQIERELQESLTEMGISASGISEIVSALDSL